jgi:hypothetical protein
MQTFQRKRVTMFTVRFKSMSAVFAVAFVTACATSSGLDSQVIEGGPGQPIVVDIVGADSGMLTDREGSRLYELQVEVSNDSDVPLTVTRIVVMTDGSGAFQVQAASQNENEMIDPGKDHIFVLKVTGRLVRAFAPNEAHVVRLRCIVALSNGDSYFYTFEGPVRES